ncbi:MAG: tol-pal system protein YbgF [Gammaproteobacteria bacterium]|nr:tol-pal system protein YbgF [Gammaproteobacteria bacterium]
MPLPRRFIAWAGGALAAALLVPVLPAVGASDGSRANLPPVVELGVGGGAASPSSSREALADLLQQLETLQTEMRNLRGQVETQANEIERLKTRQRELLADIDRRVGELERRGGAAAAPEAAGGVAAPLASPVSAQEQQDYDAAFTLMKQGFYERAAKSFSDFIAKYPQSTLRDNARYWLGEAYYVARNFRKALDEFGKVLSEHPNSAKAPDALLKTGYSHYELGEWAKARESLNQAMSRYPGTPTAKSAEQRLAKMKKEKH